MGKLSNLFDGIRAVYSVTDYEFPKVRDLFLKGLEQVMRLGHPNYVGKLVVENKSSDVVSLTIEFWFRDNQGKDSALKTSQDFYGFRHLPRAIEDELSLTGKYVAHFTKEDLGELYAQRNKSIDTGGGDIKRTVARRARGLGVNNCNVVVDIQDMIFYYDVRVHQDFPSGFLFDFLVIPVNGLEASEYSQLDANHRVQFFVKV